MPTGSTLSISASEVQKDYAIRSETDEGVQSISAEIHSSQAQEGCKLLAAVQIDAFVHQQHEQLRLLRELQQQQQQYQGQVDEVVLQISHIQETLKPLLSRKISHLSPLPPPTPR